MNKNFGERLKTTRMIMNKHQADMARRVGVSPSTWCRWESGGSKPDFDALFDLGNLLNISLDFLVLGVNTRSALLTHLLFLLSSLHERELKKMVEWVEVRFDLERERG